MPIYEYQCQQCGRHSDVFHAVGEHPGPCPWCQGTLRRVYSSVGVIFKGAGFHSTDYRKPAPQNEGEPKAPTSESPSKPAKESASEGSSPGPSSTGGKAS